MPIRRAARNQAERRRKRPAAAPLPLRPRRARRAAPGLMAIFGSPAGTTHGRTDSLQCSAVSNGSPRTSPTPGAPRRQTSMAAATGDGGGREPKARRCGPRQRAAPAKRVTKPSHLSCNEAASQSATASARSKQRCSMRPAEIALAMHYSYVGALAGWRRADGTPCSASAGRPTRASEQLPCVAAAAAAAACARGAAASRAVPMWLKSWGRFEPGTNS